LSERRPKRTSRSSDSMARLVASDVPGPRGRRAPRTALRIWEFASRKRTASGLACGAVAERQLHLAPLPEDLARPAAAAGVQHLRGNAGDTGCGFEALHQLRKRDAVALAAA